MKNINEIREMFNLEQDADGKIAVSGRELHKGLEINTEYKKWFQRMLKYGFEEGTDFIRVTQKSHTLGGVQNITDHVLTLDTAKEIAMIQRTDIGRDIRRYFIGIEKTSHALYEKYGVTSPKEMETMVTQMVNDKLNTVLKAVGLHAEQLDEVAQTIEGEYVSPQGMQAIKYAVHNRAEKFMEQEGLQMTIDTLLIGDIYEQAEANKKSKEDYKHRLGRLKSKILVAVKKHLNMKGNAPNNHIKRRDVDRAIEFIKTVKQSQLSY